MSFPEDLISLGLTEKEAKVYLAALELGEATIGEISKKSGVKRPTTYLMIEGLITQGLIGLTTVGKRKYYIASAPEKIEGLLKQHEEIFKKILPEMKAIFNVSKVKPKVQFFEGDKGIINIYMDNLTAENEILTIAGETTFQELIIKNVPDYIEQRVKKNIFLKMIVPDSPTMLQWMSKDKEELRETKVVSRKDFPFKINIDIYNNKVTMTSVTEKIGLLIESKDIADTWRSIFKLCWKLIK